MTSKMPDLPVLDCMSDDEPASLHDPLLHHDYPVFVRTVELRRERLVGVALRITGSREDAEDVVQESIMRALMNLYRFRGDARMDTWLHAIVVNTARSLLRSRRIHPAVSLEPVRDQNGEMAQLDLAHPGCTPEESCSHQELRQLLLNEISSLAPSYRAVVKLCDLHEQSYRDAARTLCLKVPAMKARLFPGRALLKRQLAHHASRPRHPAPPALT